MTNSLFRRLAVIAVCFVAACPAIGAAQAPLDPAAAYSAERRHPVTYDVDFSVIVTPPYHTHRLQVWLPVPQSDAAQEVAGSEFTTSPLAVEPVLATEPLFGNRFAYFEFDEPQGALVLRHRFQIQVWELRWHAEPAAVRLPQAWPPAFEPYLRSESQAVVLDDRLTELLADVLPQRTDPLSDLLGVTRWVAQEFKYDHHRASLRADAVRALESRTGHCSDYHGFCAAAGRVLQCPTRVTYGLNTFPKNSPSHCKLEAFLPPYGWVSFDVSETQKLVQRIQQDEALTDAEQTRWAEAAYRRLASGFRDNTWFVQTRGTDYDLAPPASRRVPLVRTAYIEADGEPLPDPDPADAQAREFAWMTVMQVQADETPAYPFSDRETLADFLPAEPSR